ncbi:MAG: peptidase P60, partial [Rhodoblastus sp.]|nr:peptidase P60 [Rhodoblastus sp.]
MSEYDRRLTPARPDLAAAHLRGKVEAARFVEGVRMQIVAPVVDLKSAPSHEAGLDTQALAGEIVTV